MIALLRHQTLLALGWGCILLVGSQRTQAVRGVMAASDATPAYEQLAQPAPAAKARIAFTSNRAGERDGSAFGGGAAHVYVMDADGGRQRPITPAPGLYVGPSWSPDGRTIAVALRRNDRFGIYLVTSDSTRGPRLFVSGATSATQELTPAWSPDGSRIAFSSLRDGNVDVYVANYDGSGLRRLTDDAAIDTSPAWSPSGKQLAFASDRSGTPHVYTMNADGSEVRRVTRDFHCDRPGWSVLNEVVYSARIGSGNVIKVIDIRTGTTRLVSDTIGDNSSPAFSPDGQQVAFVSNRTGQDQIFTMNRDGSNLRQLTTNGRNRYPAWSR